MPRMGSHMRIRSKDLTRQWDLHDVISTSPDPSTSYSVADSPTRSLRNSRLFDIGSASPSSTRSPLKLNLTRFINSVIPSKASSTSSSSKSSYYSHNHNRSSSSNVLPCRRRTTAWVAYLLAFVTVVIFYNAQTRVTFSPLSIPTEQFLSNFINDSKVSSPPNDPASYHGDIAFDEPSSSSHQPGLGSPDSGNSNVNNLGDSATPVYDTRINESPRAPPLIPDVEPPQRPQAVPVLRYEPVSGVQAKMPGLIDGEPDTQAHTPAAPTISDRSAWILVDSEAPLPPCEKVLLFQFMPWWGFASEWLLYLRAAALADKLGYVFVEDDRKWNYGRLTNYFKPRKLTCVPPKDWANAKIATPFGRPGWQQQNRLVYSRRYLSTIDDWTRETYLNSTEMQLLQEQNVAFSKNRSRDILAEGDTLPLALEGIFIDLAKATKFIWNVNDEVEAEIEQAAKALKMADNRIMIAAHIRLGDKGPEYDKDTETMGIRNTFGNLTVYLQAAHDALARVSPGGTPFVRDQPSTVTDTAFSPSLIVMTAEAGVISHLRNDPLSSPFTLVQMPSPDLQSLQHVYQTAEEGLLSKDEPLVADWAKALQDSAPLAYSNEKQKREPVEQDSSESKPKPGELSTGYSQAKFNKLPLIERIQHTRALVRDLTLLSQDADAFIVSGASNLGRLAMLIGGYEATVGYRDESGRSLGGRIRSVDSHWFPTAYSDALFHQVKDLEDLDNRPVVPIGERRKNRYGMTRRRRREQS